MNNLTLTREYYLDWIRVIAFILLIFFHSAMPFVPHPWEIKNAEVSIPLERFIMWMHQWRLPLLFFISGVGIGLSLRRRSVVAFLGERFLRLFIPLLFAMFFTIPFQVYFEWLQDGKISESFLEFYPSVWQFIPYPQGSLTWSHMWFVVYLFVFIYLLIPLWILRKIPVIHQLKLKLNNLFKSPFLVLALSVPIMVVYLTLYLDWPEQGSLLDDWFVFGSSILYLMLGFFVGDLSAFWATCERYRHLFLGIFLVCVVSLTWLFFWNGNLPSVPGTSMQFFGVLNALQIWSIIVVVSGYARHHLNFQHPWLTYLTKAVYPYYILHQTIIVAMGYYVTQWHIPIIGKYLVLSIGCLISIVLCYHFLIRPFGIMRFLYGVTPYFQKRKSS